MATKKKDKGGKPSLSQTAERDELVSKLSSIVPTEPPSMEVPADNHLALADADPWSGLSERQKVIQTLYLQGASQKVIAAALSVSQPRIAQELKKIREIHSERGATIDANAYVGETRSLFQTVEQQAWTIFRDAKNAKNSAVQIQALQMIKAARIDQTKMLMDIGLLEKQAEKHDHTHKIERPSVADNWSVEEKQRAAEAIMVSQLKALPGPTPPGPEDDDDEDIIEAEFTEDEEA